MKKSILFFSLLSIVCSCQKQETSTSIETISSTPIQPKDSLIGKFNIQEFNKHQKNNEWEYTKDNKDFFLRDVQDEYWMEVSEKNNPFILRINYYLNGNRKLKALSFHANGFTKGLVVEYNEKGNITKQTDYDAPYKDYPWEKVKVWMESKNIDLLDPLTRVWREIDNDKPIWYISWDTKKLDKYSNQIIQNVEINGKTGEIIKEYTSSFGEEIPEKYR
ncbi:hypothetical protein ETU08_02155 [Apibacter muscae]|uniref:hypothetical protein n=1 Tax=Apibacter muscae TaxID=2509004 RepID=UPI0011ACC26B|nr:hypothetical protein [Apibacter muscae]TWP30829.1 hypothetical protein ETU08_02155 [Apibacter muscae]